MRYCTLSQFTGIPLKSRHCSPWPGLSQYSGGWREEVKDLWLWYVSDGGSWGSHLCEDQHREAALEMVGHWVHSQQRVYQCIWCVGLWSGAVGDRDSRWVLLQTYTVWTSPIHPVLTINICILCRRVSLPSHCQRRTVGTSAEGLPAWMSWQLLSRSVSVTPMPHLVGTREPHRAENIT